MHPFLADICAAHTTFFFPPSLHANPTVFFFRLLFLNSRAALFSIPLPSARQNRRPQVLGVFPILPLAIAVAWPFLFFPSPFFNSEANLNLSCISVPGEGFFRTRPLKPGHPPLALRELCAGPLPRTACPLNVEGRVLFLPLGGKRARAMSTLSFSPCVRSGRREFLFFSRGVH